MKIKEQIVISIEYGSEWQKETHGSTLNGMLNVWKEFMESKHKNNKAEISKRI